MDPQLITQTIFFSLDHAISSVNVLNVYAFCNTHDVSWGTKGDTIEKMDLGVVKATSDAKTAEVTVQVPIEEKDIDDNYQNALDALLVRTEEAPSKPDPKQEQEDYYKAFRTRLVVLWCATNVMLVLIFTHGGDERSSTYDGRSKAYLGFVLWSVAFLSAFRFIGSVVYLVLRLVSGELRW